MHRNPFSDAEIARRLAAIREDMAERQLDVAVFSVPESVFYLTGLDHWGYFAPHHLVVPLDGDLTLITRAMERMTIGAQVRNARFLGHSDSETAEGKLIELLDAAAHRRGSRSPGGLTGGLTVGLEEQGTGLSALAGRSLRSSVSGVTFRGHIRAVGCAPPHQERRRDGSDAPGRTGIGRGRRGRHRRAAGWCA
jgi:Xaa-Pro dipeptidase